MGKKRKSYRKKRIIKHYIRPHENGKKGKHNTKIAIKSGNSYRKNEEISRRKAQINTRSSGV